jgi:hypothetical protein
LHSAEQLCFCRQSIYSKKDILVPKNEDGEFELILGNRQLLSVFFIVVILLGVFFTMGYIVGRNSAPALGVASASRNGTTAIPTELPPARTSEPPPSRPETAAPVETAPQVPQESAPKETARTETARVEAPKASDPPRVESPKGEASKREPAKTESAKPEKDRTRNAKKSATRLQPEPGQTYLQLAATSEHEADILADVLRRKGFKAMTAEIEEKPGTFRVLVGPLGDVPANKMRADLQNAGFPGNAAIRRTF